MKAADFIFQNKNFKQSKSTEKAVSLFEKGLTLGEVFYDLDVWSDRDLNFWQLDRLQSAFQGFEAFKAKKVKYTKDLESRQETPVGSVEAVAAAKTLTELEEAFRPFKRKKKTKATLAREAGLLDFALQIRDKALKGESFEAGIESEAKKFIQPALGFITFETVLKGVQDILVEQGLENQNLRADLLKKVLAEATVVVKAGDKFSEGGRYSNFVKAAPQKCAYYLNSKNYDKFPQMKKAWEDGFLRVTLDFPIAASAEAFDKEFVQEGTGDLADLLRQASKKALEIHALPSVTTEVFDHFYAISEGVYLSKLKTDYMSLLNTPEFGKKPVLSILEREGDTAALVFTTHSGDFVSSTTIDFSKEDVVDNLKSLIESITKNVELGCIAIALGKSVRKFEKWVGRALKELNKDESVPVVMADPRGLIQFINQPEAKFGFEDKIDNASLSGFYLAKRVQSPLLEYGAHSPSNLLDVPNFMNKAKVDEALKSVLTYSVCTSGLMAQDVTTGLMKNLGWFADKEEGAVVELCQKLSKTEVKEKKDLESVLGPEHFERFSQFFKCPEALSLLDQARISHADFSKIKDVAKEKEISLLKGPIEEAYKVIDDSWVKLLGEELSNYLKIELSTPFKTGKKPYKVFSFSKGVEDVDGVKEDNLYWGVVTKFSAFGAFIDVGVGTEGLIHLSELSNDFLSDARKVLRLGQWVLVKAIKVDAKSKKLSFSKIKAEKTFSKTSHDRSRSGKEGDDKRRSFSKNPYKKHDKRYDKKSGGRPGGKPQQRKPKVPFNNPFAALGDLKK